MKLEKAKLNPNSVNNRGTSPKPKIDMSSGRKGAGMKGKQVNPREIPTTMGYVGNRIKK